MATALQPIRRPDVLDADRHFYLDQKEFERTPEEHDKTLDEALHRVSDYGTQLWDLLTHVRERLYLAATVAERERLLSPGASEDWIAWARLYAAVTSALAGPSGDNGLAWNEAVLIARAQGVEIPADPQAV